jgi:hypothetical protein
VRKVAKIPVMVTGNFRTVAGMVAVLEAGELDMIGIGQPVISDTLAPKKILSGDVEQIIDVKKRLSPFHLIGWLNCQIERLADGMDPDLTLSGEDAVERYTRIEQRNMHALVEHRKGQA